jgi:hypothetical protein
MKVKKWPWAFALLALICVSPGAQEPEAQESSPPPQAESPSQEPASPEQQSEPANERVSADNNLSFPVDI